MSNGLYKMLANAKRQGNNDGDFINPGQQGVFCIEKLIFQETPLKKTAVLVASIVESHAKDATAKLQAPGTRVKKIYPLSKYEWVANELMTDLLNIAGVDEKTISPVELEGVFADVFEGSAGPDGKRSGVGALVGVQCTFNSKAVERAGKHNLTKVYFGEVSSEPGEPNDPAKVAERRAAILAKK